MPISIAPTNAAYKVYHDPQLTSEISALSWTNQLKLAFGERPERPPGQLQKNPLGDKTASWLEDTALGTVTRTSTTGQTLSGEYSYLVTPKSTTATNIRPIPEVNRFMAAQPRRVYSVSLSILNRAPATKRFRLIMLVNGASVGTKDISIPTNEWGRPEVNYKIPYPTITSVDNVGNAYEGTTITWELLALETHTSSEPFNIDDIYVGPYAGVDFGTEQFMRDPELVRSEPIHLYFKNSSGGALTNIRVAMAAPSLDGPRPYLEASSDPAVVAWKSAKVLPVIVREASLANGSSFSFWVRGVVDAIDWDDRLRPHILVRADH
jgi:hypothetical protein